MIDNLNYQILLKLFHPENNLLDAHQNKADELIKNHLEAKIINSLLLEDTQRADIQPYHEKILQDTELGHWSLWQDELHENDCIEATTSGTTGEPKVIKLQKKAMVHSALATADFFDLQPGNSVLHCLPTRYIAGKMMLIRAIIIGLELDIIAPTSHLDDLDSTREYDFVALVPAQAQAGLEKLNQFKKIIIGGAKLSETVTNQIKYCKATIYETYGMTETITHIAAKKIGENSFKTLPNVSISIDERGCLVIDAPNLLSEKIVTNDLIEITNENEFQWLGRIDNVINSGCIKYFPEKIEAKLASKIIQRFFIAGLPDATFGQKIALFIEGEEFAVDPKNFKTLEKFERPKEIHFIANFLEANNKLKRFEMVEQLINSL
jgi:O-succinylbenzoic acid--CoA ligase